MMMILILIGKKQRLTLIECSNDLDCMMDLAKVADLVSVYVCTWMCACVHACVYFENCMMYGIVCHFMDVDFHTLSL